MISSQIKKWKGEKSCSRTSSESMVKVSFSSLSSSISSLLSVKSSFNSSNRPIGSHSFDSS